MAHSVKNLYILGIILTAGLLLRLILLFFLYDSPLFITDEIEYNDSAVILAETGNMANKYGTLISIRPPFYIWFLAGLYKIYGVENPEMVHLCVRIIQIILSMFTTVFVYRLGREIYNAPVGLTAAGFFCFYPTLVWQNYLILTETMFTFFLTGVVLCATVLLRKPSIRLALLCGVLLGVGALTRSILWLGIPCLGGYLALFMDTIWWKRLTVAACTAGLAGIIICPWCVRNTRIHGTLTMVDCMSGRNFMMGNYEHTPLYRAWDAISIKRPHDWHTTLTHGDIKLNALSQGKKDKLAGKYAVSFISQNPWLTIKRDCVKALCFWQLERSLCAAMDKGHYAVNRIHFYLIAALTLLYYAIIFLLGVCGVFLAGPERKTPCCEYTSWRAAALWLCVIALFWGTHSLVFAHSRYHLPLVPFICIYASAYVVNCCQTWTVWRGASWWRMLGAGMTCLIFCIFWGLEVTILL